MVAVSRFPFDAFLFPFVPVLLALIVVLATTAWAAGPAPRFVGASTTVAVNRSDGRIAVMQGATLSVYPQVGAATPAASFEIPGNGPAVLEFYGNQVLYSTHGVNQMPVVFVAVSAEGRERLAWPNSGISDLFPNESSRLTLDGKGVYGFLVLDPAARTFFGMADDIPLGAGVAATYRFAGEKLLARGSEAFAGVVALAPDDMLLTLKGGGLMRVRPPGGVAWKREGRGGDWRIVDVDPKSGVAVVLDAEGAAIGTGIEKGEPRWRCAAARSRLADARLTADGRLLTLALGGEPAAVVVDPATGHPAGAQLAEVAGRQGLAQAFFDWLAKAPSLTGLVDVATPAGPAWLVRGADGWYEIGAPR